MNNRKAGDYESKFYRNSSFKYIPAEKKYVESSAFVFSMCFSFRWHYDFSGCDEPLPKGKCA